MEFFSKSTEETEKIAHAFAQNFLKNTPDIPSVLLFFGDLGAGKTSFLREFARSVGVVDRVSSPSFTLLHYSEILGNDGFSSFAHFDLYRTDEQSALGFSEVLEYFSDPKILCAVEWSEKLSPHFLPPKFFRLVFEKISENERKITIWEESGEEGREMTILP